MTSPPEPGTRWRSDAGETGTVLRADRHDRTWVDLESDRPETAWLAVHVEELARRWRRVG